MSTSLRELTIRLAATHPEMRRHLIPLLERGANTFQPAWPSAPPAPVYMQAPSPPAAAAPTYAPAPPYAPTPAPAPAPTYPAPPPYAPGAVPVILQSAPAPAPGIFQSAPPPAPVVQVQPPANAPPPTPPMAAPAPVVDPLNRPSPPPPFADSVFVTNRAQKGFDTDLRPELERMIGRMSRAQVAVWAKESVRDAFSSKDTLYLVLIRHQSTFESDDNYRLSLERAIDNWAAEGYGANQPGV